MLIPILLLGLVVGMQHAFEADHLAAVSALVSRKRGWREISRHGAIWGLGHTIALLLVSGLVLLSPWSLPAQFGPLLELVVGALLIGLGSQLLYRLWRDRVHLHAHRHDDGKVHLHAHSHHSHREAAEPHATDPHHHEHRHEQGAGLKTLFVGLTHGAAGSAALTIYVAASLQSAAAGITYIVCFGLGSIIGMAALTTILALPLTVTASRLTWANRGLQVVVALISLGLGASLAVEQAVALWQLAGRS